MIRLFYSLLAAIFMLTQPVAAQDVAYIQIEAQPSQSRATERARDFESVLSNVNAFALGGGWYGIALGPYSRIDAQALLRSLRARGQVPADSYISFPGDYGPQIWPTGAQAQQAQPQATPAQDPAPVATAEVQPEPELKPIDETPREARQSEALLSREERMELQIALQWAGVYNSGIDGAFGRGTRRSMSDWQTAHGYEPTGVLTTLQRADLLGQYNAVLDGMGMRMVFDSRAGVEIEMPTGVVGFEKYEAPFAQYSATGDIPAQVLLISQPGDRTTLYGLYEIMQTLEIVPLDGPRQRSANGFELSGSNNRIVSYTKTVLVDDTIKGFTLVWPAGDEERRTRILALMQKSFATTDAVLDPGAMTEEAQSVDLVSGLRIRKPILSRSGFYVDRTGSVLTALAAVDSCGRITLDGNTEATITATDNATGLALLKPASTLVPMRVAALGSYSPRLQSEIAVSGYSYEGALGAPTLTFGTIADLKGLSGETTVTRLNVDALPGDAGGPVLDAGGAVLGLLQSRADGARQLPPSVSFATSSAAIQAMLDSAGIPVNDAPAPGSMAPEDLTEIAAGMTVLVSCWE